MKSRFLGKVVRKLYCRDYGDKIIDYTREIGYKIAYELDLERPPLNTGENFYIAEYNEFIFIEKAMRGIDENNEEILVYITDKELEIVEDERTEETLIKAKLDVENYLKRLEQEEKDLIKNNKKWYQFWK